MSLGKAIILLCMCVACGNSTAGGSPGAVLTLAVDGVAIDLSSIARATQSNSPYLTDIGGQDASGSTFLTLELSAYPPTAATYSCPTDGVGLLYSTSSGGAYYAGVNSAALTGSTPTSCTITVTSYTAAGMPFEGTFSGTVARANVPGSTHVITNGHFKLAAP